MQHCKVHYIQHCKLHYINHCKSDYIQHCKIHYNEHCKSGNIQHCRIYYIQYCKILLCVKRSIKSLHMFVCIYLYLFIIFPFYSCISYHVSIVQSAFVFISHFLIISLTSRLNFRVSAPISPPFSPVPFEVQLSISSYSYSRPRYPSEIPILKS